MLTFLHCILRAGNFLLCVLWQFINADWQGSFWKGAVSWRLSCKWASVSPRQRQLCFHTELLCKFLFPCCLVPRNVLTSHVWGCRLKSIIYLPFSYSWVDNGWLPSVVTSCWDSCIVPDTEGLCAHPTNISSCIGSPRKVTGRRIGDNSTMPTQIFILPSLFIFSHIDSSCRILTWVWIGIIMLTLTVWW